MLSKSDNFASGGSEHSVSDPTESVVSTVSTVATVTGDSKNPVSEPTVSAATGGIEKSVSEPTVSAVTGDSMMWKPASISLAATLLLLLAFFF